MVNKKFFRWTALIVVIAVVMGGALNFSRLKNVVSQNAPASNATSNNPSPKPKNQTSQPTTVTTGSFYYTTPDNWTQITKADLDSSGAASGIKSNSSPSGTFTVAIEPAATTPKTTAELKSTTLAALKNFQNFELIANTTTTVNGQSGQKFAYRFGGQTKTRQDLIIVVYKKQAYSLLFTITDADYSKQSPIFESIINSFKFK